MGVYWGGNRVGGGAGGGGRVAGVGGRVAGVGGKVAGGDDGWRKGVVWGGGSGEGDGGNEYSMVGGATRV